MSDYPAVHLLWVAFLTVQMCYPFPSFHPSLYQNLDPHLAVELLIQQDVPRSNVSVDKGLTCKVSKTLSHLVAEPQQQPWQMW